MVGHIGSIWRKHAALRRPGSRQTLDRARLLGEMAYPHLSKAPIVEGLVDIKVKQRPGWSVEQLDPFTKKVETSYPVVKAFQEFQAELKFEQDKLPSQAIASKPG